MTMSHTIDDMVGLNKQLTDLKSEFSMFGNVSVGMSWDFMMPPVLLNKS